MLIEITRHYLENLNGRANKLPENIYLKTLKIELVRCYNMSDPLFRAFPKTLDKSDNYVSFLLQLERDYNPYSDIDLDTDFLHFKDKHNKDDDHHHHRHHSSATSSSSPLINHPDIIDCYCDEHAIYHDDCLACLRKKFKKCELEKQTLTDENRTKSIQIQSNDAEIKKLTIALNRCNEDRNNNVIKINDLTSENEYLKLRGHVISSVDTDPSLIHLSCDRKLDAARNQITSLISERDGLQYELRKCQDMNKNIIIYENLIEIIKSILKNPIDSLLYDLKNIPLHSDYLSKFRDQLIIFFNKYIDCVEINRDIIYPMNLNMFSHFRYKLINATNEEAIGRVLDEFNLPRFFNQIARINEIIKSKINIDMSNENFVDDFDKFIDKYDKDKHERYELDARINVLNSQIQSYEHTMREKENALKNLQDHINRMTLAHNDLMKNIVELELEREIVRKLREQLNQTEKMLNDSNNEHKKLTNEFGDTMNELTKLRQEIDTKNPQNIDIQRHKREMIDLLGKMITSENTIPAIMDYLTKLKIAYQQSPMDNVRLELNEILKQFLKLQISMNKLTDDMVRDKKLSIEKIEMLEKSITEVKNEIDKNSVSFLNEKRDLTLKIEQLETDKRNEQNSKILIQEELKRINENVADKDRNIQHLTQQIQDIDKIRAIAQGTIDELNNKIREYELSGGQCASNITELINAKTKIEFELDKLQIDYEMMREELNSKIETQNAIIERNIGVNKELAIKNDQLDRHNSELQTDCAILTQRKNILENENAQLREQNISNVSELTRQKQSLIDLDLVDKKLGECGTKIAVIEGEKTNLENETNSMRKTIEQLREDSGAIELNYGNLMDGLNDIRDYIKKLSNEIDNQIFKDFLLNLYNIDQLEIDKNKFEIFIRLFLNNERRLIDNANELEEQSLTIDRLEDMNKKLRHLEKSEIKYYSSLDVKDTDEHIECRETENKLRIDLDEAMNTIHQNRKYMIREIETKHANEMADIKSNLLDIMNISKLANVSINLRDQLKTFIEIFDENSLTVLLNLIVHEFKNLTVYGSKIARLKSNYKYILKRNRHMNYSWDQMMNKKQLMIDCINVIQSNDKYVEGGRINLNILHSFIENLIDVEQGEKFLKNLSRLLSALIIKNESTVIDLIKPKINIVYNIDKFDFADTSDILESDMIVAVELSEKRRHHEQRLAKSIIPVLKDYFELYADIVSGTDEMMRENIDLRNAIQIEIMDIDSSTKITLFIDKNENLPNTDNVKLIQKLLTFYLGISNDTLTINTKFVRTENIISFIYLLDYDLLKLINDFEYAKNRLNCFKIDLQSQKIMTFNESYDLFSLMNDNGGYYALIISNLEKINNIMSLNFNYNNEKSIGDESVIPHLIKFETQFIRNGHLPAKRQLPVRLETEQLQSKKSICEMFIKYFATDVNIKSEFEDNLHFYSDALTKQIQIRIRIETVELTHNLNISNLNGVDVLMGFINLLIILLPNIYSADLFYNDSAEIHIRFNVDVFNTSHKMLKYSDIAKFFSNYEFQTYKFLQPAYDMNNHLRTYKFELNEQTIIGYSVYSNKLYNFFLQSNRITNNYKVIRLSKCGYFKSDLIARKLCMKEIMNFLYRNAKKIEMIHETLIGKQLRGHQPKRMRTIDNDDQSFQHWAMVS